MTTASPRAHEPHTGFFRPYKPGQGFWTRLGTGGGAGLIILFTIWFLYDRLPVWTPLRSNGWALYAILAAVGTALAVLAWWLINRPKHAEFLIATDGEMKKVNWTGRRELIGSTKVVVFFMFFIAAMLFVYDVVFGSIFYYIKVLNIKPFFV